MFWLLFLGYVVFRVWCYWQRGRAMSLAERAYEAGLRERWARDDAAQAEFEARLAAEIAERVRRRQAEEASEDRSLRVLGLTEMPKGVPDLRRARNKLLLSVHPDHGGSDLQTAQINAAYDEIMTRLGLGNLVA